LNLTVKYSGPDKNPCDNLYIAGIPVGTDVEKLKFMFSKAGFNVQRAKIMPDKFGAGSVTGMVQVASVEEGVAAIRQFHGKPSDLALAAPSKDEMDKAVAALPAPKVPLRVSYSGRAGGEKTRNLYVAGLPTGIEQTTVHRMFVSAGLKVTRVKVLEDRQNFGSVAALVELQTQDEADAAISMFNKKVLDVAVL